MATSEQIDSAARGDRVPGNVGRLLDDHALAGAGLTYGVSTGQAAAAEAWVRKTLNRHACGAPRRLAEAERAGRTDLADDVRARPAAYCGDPRHGEDAALLADALQWLGLRPTPRPVRRSDAITVRAKRKEQRGRCPECGKRQGLRADGTVRGHGGCPGKGEQPKEETL